MRLSQERFAEVMNVSFATINRWENGKGKPSRLAMERMNDLQKYGAPINEIATDAPGTVRIKAGLEGSGRIGKALAGPIRDLGGLDWMVVQWDDKDIPELCEVVLLEIAVTAWKALKDHGNGPGFLPTPPALGGEV
jgi:transcriptional regulator with XRE-family HTH domain